MIRYKDVHEKKIEDIEKEIFSFFQENSSPSDVAIKELTESLHISHNEFNEFVYDIFANLVKIDESSVPSNKSVENFIGGELKKILDKMVKKFNISEDEAKKSINYYLR